MESTPVPVPVSQGEGPCSSGRFGGFFGRRGLLRGLGAAVFGTVGGGWGEGGELFGWRAWAEGAVDGNVAASQTSRTSSSPWTVLRFDGRDYLPLREIGSFYRLGPLERSLNQFSLRIGGASLRGHADSQEFFISRLKFILSFPIREIGGDLCMSRMDLVKVVEPVLRPGRIASAGRVDTVILDPGHGGGDSGAVGRLAAEKELTLDVAFRARAELQRAGYRVFLTRDRDEFVSLEDRARFANRFARENALFLSIHFNSSGSGSGVETFTLAPQGVPSMMADGPRVSDFQRCPGNARDAENMALATATHASLVSRARLPDRGIKRARFFVIRETVLPSVLLEGGFLSNPEEMRRVASVEYRQQMAGGILEAVQVYRRAVYPGSA